MENRDKRLYEILRLVETQPEIWTYGKLKIYFGISKTQIYRDIHKLKRLGCPIQKSKIGLILLPKEKSVTPHGR